MEVLRDAIELEAIEPERGVDAPDDREREAGRELVLEGADCKLDTESLFAASSELGRRLPESEACMLVPFLAVPASVRAGPGLVDSRTGRGLGTGLADLSGSPIHHALTRALSSKRIISVIFDC
jgi:hypothetical protein